MLGSEPPEDIHLSLYPNPFRQFLRIQGLPAGPIRVKVFNLNGTLIKYLGSVESGLLDLSDLKAGVYLITLEMGPTSFTRKIVRVDR